MAQFLISTLALQRNARLLRELADSCGARMLVALKAFGSPSVLPLLRPYAAGCCASGLCEARLGARHLGGHVAVYSPAYREEELAELLNFAHHIDFNSLPQWQRYREQVLAHPRTRSGALRAGLRVNPCHSTGHTPLYDPCIPGSRLGVPAEQLRDPAQLDGLSGLHLHTLCEQGAEELIATFRAFEREWGSLLATPSMRYLNLGGGHWITKPDYNQRALAELVCDIRQRYGVEVYLEPGEAWFIHTGVLRTRVLDIFESLGYRHAIVDASAAAHMPDVLEMPYRPELYLARPSEGAHAQDAGAAPTHPAVQLPGIRYEQGAAAGQKAHSYRIGSVTCLAGDVMGDYSFDTELHVGDELVFDDMTHYTLVKTTHFNGVPHPDIALLQANGHIDTTRRFDYEDFESRLG
ncbi:MAG: carboxynorspermidine decarboxylase [Akkermansia sp.]